MDNKMPMFVNVTPELAVEWLTRNYEKNRKIRASYVSQLAEVMKSGRYIANNGQTIVFGDDGKLYDGQHRLNAIVQSGCSQELLVVQVEGGEKTYSSIDNGTKRQAADFLDGLKDKNICAAYGKVMACVEWGNMPLLTCLQGKWSTKTYVDRGLILSYCMYNLERVQNNVRIGRRMRGSVNYGSVTAYATFIGIVRYTHKEDLLNEFVDDFLVMAPDSKTVIATKQMIMKAAIKNRAIENKWIIGTLLDAYTHYCDMDDSVMLNKQSLRIKQYNELIATERLKGQLTDA